MLHCKRNSTRKFYKHWTKQLEHLSPPSPQIKDGNVARLGIFDFLGGTGGGGQDGGLLFHFILSKIVTPTR